MDLTDATVRATLTDRLAAPIAGRPVIVGPVVLAGATPAVAWLTSLGCPVLVVATSRGAGPAPPPGSCDVVEVEVPAAPTVTEELRTLDRLARHLPDRVVAVVEAFDPDRRGLWWCPPFVTTDEPVLGRPVVLGRPAAFMAMEDKLLAEQVWAAVGLDRAPHAVVDVGDDARLRAATRELAGPLGTVWSVDARDGFNGGGDFVRWVRDERDVVAAAAFFKLRCDQVRVAPFLDGVPCSIHGIVLPDGTAALRPVEIATLRAPGAVLDRRLVHAGVGTHWDPPPDDRDRMRDAVRRVGEHLRAAHGYRGAFGIDGVLSADGWRPTELNTRMSAGLGLVAELDRWFFTLLQVALVQGWDTGVGAADVEALVPLMDAERRGRVVAFGTGDAVTETTIALTWDGRDLVPTPQVDVDDASDVLLTGTTPSGWFARVQPCSALARPGDRLAVVDVALLALLDRLFATGTGALEIAPDVRAH